VKAVWFDLMSCVEVAFFWRVVFEDVVVDGEEEVWAEAMEGYIRRAQVQLPTSPPYFRESMLSFCENTFNFY